MTNPTVSVVVPVYNTQPFLDRCIKSIINQTYTSLEIILVDDGSTDTSPLICDKYAEQDSRVIVFHNANKGANRARHFGVKKSNGSYVMFVDSDDWLQSCCVEELVARISDSIDIVIGLKWEANGPDTIFSINEWRSICAKGGLLMSLFAKLFKKVLFDDFIFDIPTDLFICEDDIVNIRIAWKAKNDVVLINKCLYCYNCDNKNSITHNFNWTYHYCSKLYEVILLSIPSYGYLDVVHSLIDRRVKSVHGLVGGHDKSLLSGLTSSQYLLCLKEDVKKYHYTLSPFDRITLYNPESCIVFELHRAILRFTVIVQYFQRRFQGIFRYK